MRQGHVGMGGAEGRDAEGERFLVERRGVGGSARLRLQSRERVEGGGDQGRGGGLERAGLGEGVVDQGDRRLERFG